MQSKRWSTWAPGALCTLAIPFVSLFALDVFEEAHGISQTPAIAWGWGLAMCAVPCLLAAWIFCGKRRRKKAGAVIAMVLLAALGGPSLRAQQNPRGRAAVQRSKVKTVAYFAAGAGLFFGGAVLLNSADRYRQGTPVCPYPLGCYTPSVRVTSRGRQAGGIGMMASGGVLAVLGVREWYRKPFLPQPRAPRKPWTPGATE